MARTPFDRLRTLRLASEGPGGRAEVCRGPDGTCWVRLSVFSPACQRELLSALDPAFPVRLERGRLELLLPWRAGLSLRRWIDEQRPTLGQRRDACLSLLGQQADLRRRLPPCLTALSARTDNVVVDPPDLVLQYLPGLDGWEPDMGEAAAVRATAAVICDVLTLDLERGWGRPLPEEVQLLYRRLEAGDYASWGQLQRDVAAIPEDLPSMGRIWRLRLRRLEDWLLRQEARLLRALAVLLAAAALLSLLSAYRQWRRGREASWQGMPLVGDQDLRREGSGG